MPWYRWKDPAREGLEVEIRTTAGRAVKGRIVSHGAEVADLGNVDLARCDVQTTVIDEQGRYYTGREVARPDAMAPPAAA
ncbi:MAG TPA: hypothetical protein VEA38_16715 [Terriglobales bacterium]|nr:hypothetical protein [Terriglobales bacterium]